MIRKKEVARDEEVTVSPEGPMPTLVIHFRPVWNPGAEKTPIYGIILFPYIIGDGDSKNNHLVIRQIIALG